MIKEEKVILHKGIYKPTATVGEAVFMITGMTIGAGILAIPYAVSRVGLLVGLAYIAGLGFIMMFLNLMIGEIASRTNESLQLAGFAGKYLGAWAKYFLSAIFLFSAFGTLLVYIIGEGAALAAVFGGNQALWSTVFWSVGSFVVWGGLKRVKSVDRIFGVIIMSIIVGLSLLLLLKFDSSSTTYFNSSYMFFPIGVILFALHASPAIAEAHTLLPNRGKDFRKAVIIGTLIPIFLYLFFALSVVGFSGLETTEIATIGIGKKLGPFVGLYANIFAILAMCTGFVGLGTALRETLSWDLKIKDSSAVAFVVAVPFILFLFGIRNFSLVLDSIGAFAIASEAVIMALVYLKARKGANNIPDEYIYPKYPVLLSVPVIFFFSTLLLFSFYRFFIK